MNQTHKHLETALTDLLKKRKTARQELSTLTKSIRALRTATKAFSKAVNGEK